MAAAGLGPGDEVIVPAISFISSATAVSRAGATPVFADIEPYSFNLDPERAEAAISPRTRAIMPVHFGGPLADMDRLMALAAARGLDRDRGRRARARLGMERQTRRELRAGEHVQLPELEGDDLRRGRHPAQQ